MLSDSGFSLRLLRKARATVRRRGRDGFPISAETSGATPASQLTTLLLIVCMTNQ